MHADSRAEFLAAWNEIATSLVAVTSLVDDFPDKLRQGLLAQLNAMKASQIRRFREAEALSPSCSASAVLLQGFRAQQRVLVEDVRSLIVHATAMRAALRTTIAAAAGPQLSLPPPSPGPVSELRDFAGEFYAALAQIDRAARSAVAAPLPHHHEPVPDAHGALPPAAAAMRRTSREEDWETDEEETGRARSRRRKTRPAARRESGEAAGTLLVSAIKSIGGTGTMLLIAVLINGIAFADRIISSSMPSSQLFARVRPQAEESPPPAVAVARPPEAGEKTFYAPLERVAEPLPLATAGPAVAPALPPWSARAATVSIPASTVHEPAPPADPTPRAKPQVIAKAPAAAPQPPAPVRKVAAVAARPELPLAPVTSARASASEDGDGLYVVVLSTHKDAGEARDEFAQLQKKYAAVLGSKQPEVQVVASQTGSWHRLVATPALSKTAATEICSSLRSAGYGRCWVKQY